MNSQMLAGERKSLRFQVELQKVSVVNLLNETDAELCVFFFFFFWGGVDGRPKS